MDSKKPNPAAFTPDELLLLNNALNEVCNGIAIDDNEFQTRLGVDRKAARRLLTKLGSLVSEGGKK